MPRQAVSMLGFFPLVNIQEKIDDQAPIVKRVFRKKQSDTYEVSIDTEGPSGSAHYDYQIRFQLSGALDPAKPAHFAVTFINLRGTVGDLDVPKSKLFGASQYDLADTGWPTPFSLVGGNGPFLVPILSWYLPSGVAALKGPMLIPDETLDGSMKMGGTDTLIKLEKGKAIFKLALAFAVRKSDGSGYQDANAGAQITSSFDAKSGRLDSAEGTMKGFGGQMSFKLKHS